MKTFNRICIQNYFVEAKNGDRLDLYRGKEYLTSDVDDKNEVIVFSQFWVPVPISIFAGEEVFTSS